MNYTMDDLSKLFDQWLETNYLPKDAQLLWYKIITLFNKAGWSEWIGVDNQRLMSIMQIKREQTIISLKDKLVENKFFEFKKGKKGQPNRYKICTFNFESTNSNKNSSKNSNINRSKKRSRKRRHIYITLH